MTKKLDRGQGKAIKWVLKISILTIFVILGLGLGNLASATDLEIDFETIEGYEVGQLHGQVGWSGDTYLQVVDDEFYTGSQSVEQSWTGTGSKYIEKILEGFASSTASGTFYWTFAVRDTGDVSGRLMAISDGDTFQFGLNDVYYEENWQRFAYVQNMDRVDCTNGSYISYYSGNLLAGTRYNDEWMPADTWVWFIVEINFDTEIARFSYYYDEMKIPFEWSEENDTCFWWHTTPDYYFSSFRLSTYYGNTNIDQIKLGSSFTPPPLPDVNLWVVSPENESTITDIEDEITFAWENWDFEDIWTELDFFFVEKNTGIVAGEMIVYEPGTESGEIAYKFSDFGFDKNGDYYLKGRKGCVKYGQELIFPNYWITIEIEGWPSTFSMPDWEDWYSAHTDKYATSSPVFYGIAGVLSPVFSEAGEFGFSALAFLDPGEAYDTGYQLGLVIPRFRHYIDLIEVFFGGFPIIRIFLIFLVVLLLIFLIRLILKFIPGLG
ncbi:MAG TPA: hypothetical protein VMW50_11575 [Dehalococcoidia bacterium]|nr:hypothetical protein [Dehalococcoidia bacterium]